MRFTKYEALGNDYLVAESANVGESLPPGFIQRLCDRHFGVGAAPSPVRTAGGLVTCQVASAGQAVSVAMGVVSFSSRDIPVSGRDAISIEIWERGAGYTLASGASSCAGAAVCQPLEGVRDGYPD